MSKKPRGPLGEYLRQARKQAGLTQKELADELERSKSWVASLERGHRAPTNREVMFAMADVLEVPGAKLWAQAMKAKHFGLTASRDDDSTSGVFEDLAETLERVEAGSLDESDNSTDTLSPVRARKRSQLEDFGERVAQTLFPFEIEMGQCIPITDALRGPRNLDLQRCTADNTPITFKEISKTANGAINDEARIRFYEGKLEIQIREDVFEQAQKGVGRSRFACAHEIAHALYHGQELREVEGEFAHRDPKNTATEQLPENIPVYQSAEYQANVIAAAMLMPLKAVRAFIAKNESESRGIQIHEIAKNFRVSHQAARIRVERLLPRLATKAGEPVGSL